MSDAELKQKLATCWRILNRLGLFDIYGHISCRVPGSDTFYITATLGSTKEVFTPDSLVLCDYTGKKLGGNGTVPLEVVLHSVLHKTREDAVCVAHVHPYYSMALAIAGIPFSPVTLQGAPLGDGVPVYEKSEILVNEEHGKKLLGAVGSAKAILLRGHGVITVGASIEETTYLTIYLEENCKYLLEAAKAGKAVPLTREEIKERMDQMAESAKKGNPYKRIFDLFDEKTRQ